MPCALKQSQRITIQFWSWSSCYVFRVEVPLMWIGVVGNLWVTLITCYLFTDRPTILESLLCGCFFVLWKQNPTVKIKPCFTICIKTILCEHLVMEKWPCFTKHVLFFRVKIILHCRYTYRLMQTISWFIIKTDANSSESLCSVSLLTLYSLLSGSIYTIIYELEHSSELKPIRQVQFQQTAIIQRRTTTSKIASGVC